MTDSTDSIPYIDESDPNLLVKLRLLEVKKEQLADLTDEVKVLQAEVEAMVVKSATFRSVDGRLFRASVSRPKGRVNVDLGRLMEVDPELFERITKPVVDSPALTRALEQGWVSEATASQTMTVTPITPSVRIDLITEEES